MDKMPTVIRLTWCLSWLGVTLMLADVLFFWFWPQRPSRVLDQMNMALAISAAAVGFISIAVASGVSVVRRSRLKGADDPWSRVLFWTMVRGGLPVLPVCWACFFAWGLSQMP
jgi:hypothetical protein